MQEHIKDSRKIPNTGKYIWYSFVLIVFLGFFLTLNFASAEPKLNDIFSVQRFFYSFIFAFLAVTPFVFVVYFLHHIHVNPEKTIWKIFEPKFLWSAFVSWLFVAVIPGTVCFWGECGIAFLYVGFELLYLLIPLAFGAAGARILRGLHSSRIVSRFLAVFPLASKIILIVLVFSLGTYSLFYLSAYYTTPCGIGRNSITFGFLRFGSYWQNECLATKAFEQKNFDLCEQAITPSSCYLKLASLSGDFSLCKKITVSHLAENCHQMSVSLNAKGAAEKALKEGDPAICDNSQNPALCYVKFVEIAPADELLCLEIAFPESIDRCYQKAAFSKTDASLCKKISTVQGRDGCYNHLVKSMDDPSLCDKIVEYRDRCYFNVAEEKKDPALCTQIKDEHERGYCGFKLGACKVNTISNRYDCPPGF